MVNITEQQAEHDKIPYLAELNASQKVAVTNTEGPFIVIAGAGSGKTKVLTSRIAYLLKMQKATPDQVLALTFTNKAAAEMRHRIESIVGQQAKELWLGTFHSVFMKLLRCEAQHIGYPANFSIYDVEDSKSLLKQIVKNLSLDDNVYKVELLLSRISNLKNKLITPQAYSLDMAYQMEDDRLRIPRFSEIFLYYVNLCKQAGAMDFDDLLLQTYTLLCTNEKICAKYQKKFCYLFIDEFQDTNLVQYRIVRKLAELHQNICVVGDDAQSIYAFRGANIENMLSFSKDYPNHTVVKLEQNYRSSQHIVEASNRVIQHNASQLKKTIWTANSPGEPIEVLAVPSDIEESRLVVETLLSQKWKNQLYYHDFAILYRKNSQSRHFEEVLRKKNIPYRIMGGMSFYQRKEVKDLLAYLRFVINHNDIEAFKRIINLPKRGIGSVTVQKLLHSMEEQNMSLWHILTNVSNFCSGSTVASIGHFVDLIHAATAKLSVPTENAYTIAMNIAQKSGLLKELYVDKTVEGLTRYEHIQELLNSIKQFVDDPDNDEADLGSFLQSVALMTNGDQDPIDQDAVSLMTVHASKGLEFKYVYLVGMEEEIFPSSMMLSSREDLEEERRLFYVAVTRAKLKLTLSYALSRYQYGKFNTMKPSRFLKEVLQTTDLEAQQHMSFSSKAQGPFKEMQGYDTALKIGCTVKHAHFGTGKVTKLIVNPDMQKVEVLFDGCGQKTLLIKYAKLEVIKS